MTHQEYIEEVSRKIRLTVKEFVNCSLENAVIIDSFEYDCETICGIRHLIAPTVSGPILASVEYKVARFFEDA